MPSPSAPWSRSRRLLAGAVAAALLLGASACADDGTDDRGDGSSATSSTSPGTDAGTTDGTGAEVGAVTATEVAVLDEPIMLLPRAGDDHLWVAERSGPIRRLAVDDDGSLTPDGDPVLDLTDETTTDAERGVLGLAFSADGATLYVSHTDPEGTSIVAAYEVTETGDDGPTVDPDSRQVLLTQEQPYPNHNGGHLLVDGDGQLWFGLGDGGAADDPENRAQDPDTLLGKLLRVDLSGDEDHEIVALGLRNPWRFAIDPQDQVMWIADVGQNEVEEVNRTPLADLEGANFGWSGYEGDQPYLDGDGRRPDDPVMPVFTYRHDGEPGGCSVTGGVVYRGTDLPGLDGAYLISDYCGGWVHALIAGDEGAVTAVDLGLEVPGPISFGTDADGRVYVLSADGPVLRIDPA